MLAFICGDGVRLNSIFILVFFVGAKKIYGEFFT